MGSEESWILELMKVGSGERGEEEGNDEREDEESDIEVSCVPPTVGTVRYYLTRSCGSRRDVGSVGILTGFEDR